MKVDSISDYLEEAKKEYEKEGFITLALPAPG